MERSHDCLSATPLGKPERLEEPDVQIGILYAGHKVGKERDRGLFTAQLIASQVPTEFPGGHLLHCESQRDQRYIAPLPIA